MLRGVGALLERQREQQTLDGDVGVAGLLRDLLGVVEEPRRGGRHIELAGARPCTFGSFASAASVLAAPRASAAGAVDKPGGEPFLVVEQTLRRCSGVNC